MIANATSEMIRSITPSDFDFTGTSTPARYKDMQEVFIVDHSGEHLKQPISISTEQTERGNWVAYHPVILTHGYGKNPVEAAKDFHDMMIGLYLELSESEEELAPHLLDELNYLREIINENSLK
jgi:hypothetical protein